MAELYWDPIAGELREKEPEQIDPSLTGDDVNKEEEDDVADEPSSTESSDSESEEEGAQYDDASTPQLIQSALQVGGDLAASVTDTWIGDEKGLYFYYSSAEEKIYLWNPSNRTMYHWLGPRNMVYLWAGAHNVGFGGAAPPASSPEPAKPDQVMWVTSVSPTLLWPQADEEEITVRWEIPSKAMGHFVGKAGSKINALREQCSCKMELDQSEKKPVLVMTGTKAAITQAGGLVDQTLLAVVGKAGLIQLKNKRDQKYLQELKNQKADTLAQDALVPGMPEFAEKWSLDVKTLRAMRKLDVQMRKYIVAHFAPTLSKGTAALRKYIAALMQHPQRWRLEGLQESGDLEQSDTTEVVSTAIVGKITGEAQADEQRIDLEGGDPRKFGDLQEEHCRLMKLGGDFYCMALEGRIGTIIDDKKWRSNDGPVALKDGSTIKVGKYLLHVEVGTADELRVRRQRLAAGERFWVADIVEDDEDGQEAEKELEEKADVTDEQKAEEDTEKETVREADIVDERNAEEDPTRETVEAKDDVEVDQKATEQAKELPETEADVSKDEQNTAEEIHGTKRKRSDIEPEEIEA